jgi:hypothetical protein
MVSLSVIRRRFLFVGLVNRNYADYPSGNKKSSLSAYYRPNRDWWNMRDDSSNTLDPGPAHIRDAARIVLDRFVERLAAEAAAHHGTISLAALKTAFEAFHPLDAPDFQALFIETWQGCYAVAESAHWAKARRSHFERIMVKCFADLLPRSSEPVVSGKHLSRRIIPGFINALEQMMGQEIYSKFRERVDAIVDTMRAVHGDAFLWDDVYDDPICQTVVEDVLVGVSHHFSDMAKRRNWLVDVISGQMPPSAKEAEKAWYFGDAAFHMLMNALYEPLRQRILSTQDRQGLVDRHGEAEIAHLSQLFAGLAADHADLVQAGRI